MAVFPAAFDTHVAGVSHVQRRVGPQSRCECPQVVDFHSTPGRETFQLFVQFSEEVIPAVVSSLDWNRSSFYFDPRIMFVSGNLFQLP